MESLRYLYRNLYAYELTVQSETTYQTELTNAADTVVTLNNPTKFGDQVTITLTTLSVNYDIASYHVGYLDGTPFPSFDDISFYGGYYYLLSNKRYIK